MIYTVTLNPSLDYNIQLDNFQEGKLNIIKSQYKTAGGKGINVSIVLSNLEHDSTAMGFLGGFTGKFIQNKIFEKNINNKKNIDCDFIEIDQDTRINVKIKNGNSETEINDKHLYISENQLEQLFQKIERLKKDDILVLSGSVPSSLDQNIYKKISDHVNQNSEIIIDTKGKALELSLSANPFLIKPNQHELEDFFDVKISGINDFIKYGKKLRELGAKNVIISMAGDGALLVSEKGNFLANVPKGKVKNSVGAGDSLIGGFIASREEKKDILECFKNGVAAGSASAYSNGLCKKEDVEKLINQISIKKIKGE